MPVLPLIDFLIFLGWSSLMVAFVLKAITISTRYQPTIFELSAIDFLTFSVVCMLFAVALAGRAWVKANEDHALRARRLSPREAPTAGRGVPEGRAEGDADRRPVAAGR